MLIPFQKVDHTNITLSIHLITFYKKNWNTYFKNPIENAIIVSNLLDLTN
jgi:hypothetical protein